MIATSPEARVQRELDELAEAIGHSVSVDDAGGVLVGYSAQGDDVDRVRVQAILTRRVPRDVLEYQRRHGVESAGGPAHVPASKELGMAARLCIPLGRGLGYLWILDEDHALGPGEVASARKTARRLARLLKARAAGARAVDAQFERVLRARRPGADAIPRLRELAGIEDETPVRVAVALPATARAPQTRLGDPVAPDWTDAARSLPRLRFVAAAHVQPEHVALLVLARADLEAVAETLSGASRQSAVVGISPAARLAPQSLGRQQATATLAAGCASVDASLPQTLAWAGLGIYRRLLLTTRPSSWNDGPLLNRSALLEQTLETYLDNAGDASRTAAILNIHRTTLYYRLGRLKTEHGVDLHDGLTRTDLHAATKLRRLALARRRFDWPDALVAQAIAGDEQAHAAAP